jgi:hypothetical protein
MIQAITTGFAWLTAIVAGIQLGLGIYEQWRENKVSRAKFGCDLVEAIFANELVLKCLNQIDASLKIDAVRRALDLSLLELDDDAQRLREGID